jgi:hypothetical protein
MLPTHTAAHNSSRRSRTILGTAVRQLQLRFSRRFLRTLRRVRPYCLLGLALAAVCWLYYLAAQRLGRAPSGAAQAA